MDFCIQVINMLSSLSLMCCISTQGIVAFKWYKGGIDSYIFEDFLEGVFNSLLFNYDH